jgi:hypothetical protein
MALASLLLVSLIQVPAPLTPADGGLGEVRGWQLAIREWRDCIADAVRADVGDAGRSRRDLESRVAAILASCPEEQERVEYQMSFAVGAVEARRRFAQIRALSAATLREHLPR